jgi:hypothetical protein
MQEKDIRKKLNQELENMTPDILDKILNTPMEPVKSEKELMGKHKTLFKEKNNIKQYMVVPAIAALAACFIAAIIFAQTLFVGQNNSEKLVAFSIIVDVNPSIAIDVNEDGTINKLKAVNKDAKNIVNYIRSELQDEDDYRQAMKLVIKNLKKEGYLSKKENAMLVSAVTIEEDVNIDQEIREIKIQTKKSLTARNIDCKTMYQKVDATDNIKRIAHKNNVSVGKAALCVKIAQANNASVNQMCKENISTLINHVQKIDKLSNDSNIIIDQYNKDDGEVQCLTEETTFNEWETMTDVSETSPYETVEETTLLPEETTYENFESVSEVES